MNKDIFSGLALDESVPLSCVKPLHHTLFSAQLRHSPFGDVRHLPDVKPFSAARGSWLSPTTPATVLHDPQTRRHACTNRVFCLGVLWYWADWAEAGRL